MSQLEPNPAIAINESTSHALDLLWKDYESKWKRLLSSQFITELSLRSIYDVQPINLKKIASIVPAGTVPDCPNCEDICCQGAENVVSLRLSDIARLIDLGRTDLISKSKPRFTEQMMSQRPALFELMGSELWLTLPVLKQLGPYRMCAALDQDLKCSLYPHWPLSCERFPYSLNVSKKKVFWGSRCQSKSCSSEHETRGVQMVERAGQTYNERIKDAVLLTHARKRLDDLGIGVFLSDPQSPKFEELAGSLPIL